MKTHLATFTALAGVLSLGLGGCMHMPSLASMIRPHATDLGPTRSSEDRLYADAVRAIDKRNYGEAIDLLQLARDAQPGDARVLTAMGVVYDKLGRFDLSDRYYDQAEKADPGSRIVALDRRYSMFLRSAGKSGAAEGPVLAQSAPGVSLTPASGPAAILGEAPAQSPGRVQSLAAAVRQGEIAPSGDRLYALGVKAIEAREYGRAMTILREARDAQPGDVRILTALAVTYDHLGRFDLSSRYYDQAEKLAPGSPVLAQDRRASAMLQQHGGYEGPAAVTVLAGVDGSGKVVRQVAAVKSVSGVHG